MSSWSQSASVAEAKHLLRFMQGWEKRQESHQMSPLGVAVTYGAALLVRSSYTAASHTKLPQSQGDSERHRLVENQPKNQLQGTVFCSFLLSISKCYDLQEFDSKQWFVWVGGAIPGCARRRGDHGTWGIADVPSHMALSSGKSGYFLLYSSFRVCVYVCNSPQTPLFR